jgi:hypothetical protein
MDGTAVVWLRLAADRVGDRQRGAVGLALATSRRGAAGEVLSYVPVLLVFGAVIAFVLPLLEKNFPDGGLPIRGYGVMLLIAVVAGVTLAARQAARMGLNPDIIYSFAFWVFVAGSWVPEPFLSSNTGINSRAKPPWRRSERS